ncbi:hypothetical protein CVO77_08255 [Sphingopyxis lindanitolerans]|jgi:hypothetical protein|uniref:Uncharacterized protein n=3 Tax=Sphingopyxis TaxID=165697 RepID=A0A0N9UUF9_SPHMC|nr:hypothetical protein AN936_02250 [Sphingopyxis macrogoltabida]OWQ94271.1 hypothetical protein CDQ91_16725 [Sphingopyxis witflariensis]PQM28449.1 hypothetical protein CVO77_08255 [Sphingopyxis lindanitolerans]
MLALMRVDVALIIGIIARSRHRHIIAITAITAIIAIIVPPSWPLFRRSPEACRSPGTVTAPRSGTSW